MNDISIKKYYIASVSGGKDSLLMLKKILENPAKYPLNAVVHFELEIDYPFIKNVVDYMQVQCESRGILFYRIKPRKTWQELYNVNGFPTRSARWCLGSYKLDCKKQFSDYVKSLNMQPVYYIGYCADELKRYEKRHNKNEIYPLVDLGIEENIVLQWAKSQSIFNDYYKYNTRCGCMFCPLMSRKQMAYLYVYYYDQYKKMMDLAKFTELQREKELKRKFSVWSSFSKYDTDYMSNLIPKKYVPLLLQCKFAQGDTAHQTKTC